MIAKKKSATILLGSFFLFAPAFAQDVDTRPYHLFNPTPRDKMRAFPSDNGGITNTPYTVDAGHVSIEDEIVNLQIVKQKSTDAATGATQDVETTTTALNNINVKLGLTDHLDAEVAMVADVTQKVTTDGVETSNQSGVGNTTMRFKFNIWGNNGGNVGLGVIPFVVLSTAAKKCGRTTEIREDFWYQSHSHCPPVSV